MALLPVLMLFDQMHGEQQESNMTIIHALKSEGSNFMGQNARLRYYRAVVAATLGVGVRVTNVNTRGSRTLAPRRRQHLPRHPRSFGKPARLSNRSRSERAR